MNILVLTSAMLDSDYDVFEEHAKVKPNQSNQIFYSRLIKALAINNKVAVVSHRPLTKEMFSFENFVSEQTISKGIHYYYTSVKSNLFYKTFNETNEIIKAARFAIHSYLSKNFIIVVESLNYHLTVAALKLAKQYKTKVVGMLTEDSKNLHKASKFDAYLSLSKSISDSINTNKPSYVFEGLVEEEEGIKKDRITDYFFFCGKLNEKEGVKTLVDAFRSSLCKSKLIIAGNGPLANYIDSVSKIDSRILYLDQLSKEKIIGYEKNAIACINPKPVDNKSVPIKLHDYLSSGIPTISTKYDPLFSLFESDAFWMNDDSQATFKHELERFEELSSALKLQKALSAKNKAFDMYSLEIQGELITHFLFTIK